MESNRKSSDLPLLDKNIIKGIPWAEAAREILVENMDRAFLRWCQIVLNMGEKEEAPAGWVKSFIDTFDYTGHELVVDMESIVKLRQKIQQLCETLHLEMPVVGNDQLSLHQHQQQLKKRIAEYEQIIEERQQMVTKLQKKELELCNLLGKEPKLSENTSIPSTDEIKEMQEYLEKLCDERFDRLDKFTSVKEELLAIVDELRFRPSSQFEKDVLIGDDSQFLLTDKNMELLENLRRDLHKQLKNVKDEIAHLRNSVEECWTLLEFDLQDREKFRQNHKRNSIDTLDTLRLEMMRCVDLKKANIKIFIDKLREELNQLWEKCHCSQATKGLLQLDCYNEDILELHEVELKKWRAYYDENRELLTLLEKHRDLWNKMLSLEDNVVSAKERYNNRGGQLLKEEKERNKLSKQIPQIEETLITLAERYAVRHYTTFTTFGETVADYISHLHENRENAKKQRLSARKLLRDQTVMTPAKSATNLFPSMSKKSPLPSAKRKLATPVMDDKKKAKMVLSERKDNKTVKAVTPIIIITSASGNPEKSKRLSLERKRRIDNIRRRSTQKCSALAATNSN